MASSNVSSLFQTHQGGEEKQSSNQGDFQKLPVSSLFQPHNVSSLFQPHKDRKEEQSLYQGNLEELANEQEAKDANELLKTIKRPHLSVLFSLGPKTPTQQTRTSAKNSSQLK